MPDLLMSQQSLIRISVFTLILVSMAIWEIKKPKKRLTQPKLYRWTNNLGLVLLNSVLLPFTLPFLAISFAYLMQNNHVGLFYWFNIPAWLNVVCSLLLLDVVIYWQHRLFHKTPLLWRLHRVHHADQDIDVTTGSRFHFIEIWLSMLIKLATIALLGISPLAVFVFEIILNASAMFNHSNVSLSYRMDDRLRKWIVTPDMHRVHHSIHRNETDSNYGFCLSVWDRWFGSYISQPKGGHENMTIGINLFRSTKEQSLLKMLSQPFRNNTDG